MGPPNRPKKWQIVAILRETDSWLDSQNVHMKFVQISTMPVLKRKMKNAHFLEPF